MPHHNHGSVDLVIDQFTNYQNEDSKKFVKLIMPAIQTHPKFSKLSSEEIHELIRDNLPETAKKLRLLSNPLK